jgi:hypothetical protein
MTLYKSIEDWIPQPGRITRSWSSGLVLLQQEFIGSILDNGLVATEGDPFPGDDAGTGAKVYGVPEYRDLGNGLQSAVVSAYGIVPGKAGVETMTEISFSFSIMRFDLVKKYPALNPPQDIQGDYKEFPVLITNKKFAKIFLKSSPSTISTPPNDDDFKILAIGPIGAVAAGASLKGATFTVSQIFPYINSAWSGNHSPWSVTSSIFSAFGVSTEFQNFGNITEATQTFTSHPNAIDFGEFVVPQTP